MPKQQSSPQLKQPSNQLTKKQKAVVTAYARLAKKLNKYPSRSDLIQLGISRDSVRSAFGTMDNLKVLARELLPDKFANIIDTDYFNDALHQELKQKVKAHKTFVITTAVGGAPVDEDFLASIKTYCREKNAALFICPANYALQELDQELVESENIVFKGLTLNSNISISPVKIDPKQVDPTTGLDLVGQREGTILLASPKQRRRPIANSNSKLAHILQGTGAITKPRYVPKDGVPKRRDFLASRHHVMGAIIVELEDDKLYHFRQIEMMKDGSFNDLFVNYSADGAKSIKCLAVVQGDFHCTETDLTADAVADELCRLGNPKYRVLHDFFSGVSINHHEERNKVLRAALAGENKLDLASELQALKNTLDAKLKLNTSDKIVIVKSNHDEFLDRYLANGEFSDQNRIISTKLQILAMQGKDPLKAGLEELFGFKGNDRVIWLKRDEDFRISRGKIEVGCHGDLGANGKRNPGSMGMLKAYGDCIFGHCHYGEINHGAISVGTSSILRLGYNKGASSWIHAHCILYEDGSRQLINAIYGRYTITK